METRWRVIGRGRTSERDWERQDKQEETGGPMEKEATERGEGPREEAEGAIKQGSGEAKSGEESGWQPCHSFIYFTY